MKTKYLGQDRSYLLNKFQKPVFDPASGLGIETIKANIMALVDDSSQLPHSILKAKAFEYVTRNVQIDVNPHDWFVAFGCWNSKERILSPIIGKWNEEINDKYLPETYKSIELMQKTGTNMYYKDFDHSVPDWDAVFALGFPGLRERARCCCAEREKNGLLNDEAKAYFEGIEITYSAILDMLARFRDYALSNANGNERVLAVAECLNSLIHGAPTNTFEVLQLIYLYFIFGEYIDGMQVRSLGNLDRTLYPYYRKDLEDGRFTEENIREFFAYFMMQWGSIDNYWGHPFYLGGTQANGETEINELSYLILDVFDELSIPTPKIQLKTAENTPVKFLNKAFDMIRRGHSSLVFVCEPSIKRAMMAAGYSAEEARTCDIKGCYEFAPRACCNGTAGGHINMLKPFELIFNQGIDPMTGIDCGINTEKLENLKTFDDFYSAYIKQLGDIIEKIIFCTNAVEAYLQDVNPANVLSATVTNSLNTAKDAFTNGSKYNVTAILNAGFGTAVDALMAVKKFVYDKKTISLKEFKEILNNNWVGHEKLRLKILNNKNKYGNGIEAVDFYAEMIARFVANKINLRPNSRNGYYIASAHSARTFITLGEKTGATPDGRMAGEEMSKNISSTMGMDVSGVTALVKSVTRIDSAMFPGDFPLDVMLHPATVQGEEGLAAMRTLLKVYMAKHGIAIHFNIFDAEVLLDAQKHPEKYQSLQVRVCGWNVRFNDIAKKEQDAYIKRAQNISE
jgi:trans-4-hydroxy-L-proline dehydratase